VRGITWTEAVRFANELSRKEGLEPCYSEDGGTPTWSTGVVCTGFRLPTEAEWEHAVRYLSEPTSWSTIPVYANDMQVTSPMEPHPVGIVPPTPSGLYDAAGNVWEWTWDFWSDYSEDLPKQSGTDPLGPDNGYKRVRKGGSFATSAVYLYPGGRSGYAPGSRSDENGFRLVRTVPAERSSALPEHWSNLDSQRRPQPKTNPIQDNLKSQPSSANGAAFEPNGAEAQSAQAKPEIPSMGEGSASPAAMPSLPSNAVPPHVPPLQEDPQCRTRCEETHASCSTAAEAACQVAKKAAEKGASRVLGNVPGGALLSKAAGNAAGAACEERLAPCESNLTSCIQACTPLGGP